MDSNNEIRSLAVMSTMRRGWLGAALLLGAAILSACGSPAAGGPSPSVTVTISATASPTPTPTVDCADQVFASMTSDQRIGQLFELGLAGDRLGPTEINMISSDHIGSVWFVDRSNVGTA